MIINSIKEFLENRKKVLLEELSLISSNFEEMNLNNSGNFDYPFFDSFDEIVASLSIENDYEDIKEIHSVMIQRLEEANEREKEIQLEANDLEEILKLDIVEEATLENFNGFGTGILKDGRPFCFGRANGPLEMDIYENQEALENGLEAVEFKNVCE